MSITNGRFINYNDINENRKVAIIGEGVRNELYEKDEAVLNTYIKINGVNFTVIGTYKKKSNQDDGEEHRDGCRFFAGGIAIGPHLITGVLVFYTAEPTDRDKVGHLPEEEKGK